MTPGDVASIPPGYALVVRKSTWSLVEVVTTHHTPWQHVIATSEARPVDRPTPPNLRRPVPALPSIDDLVAKVSTNRPAKSRPVTIPGQPGLAAPQRAPMASMAPPVVDLLVRTVPPVINLMSRVASRLLAATEPRGSAAEPEVAKAGARSGGSGVAAANAAAEARARRTQVPPRLVRLRVIEDVNDVDDAGL